MSTIDVDACLREVSPDAPCGENLEYDPAFVALERDIQGKPESQYGNTIIPAEPPEWKAIRQTASELAGRTRDLRVTIYLIRALLHTEGLAGLADGLALLRGLLDTRWDGVHPQLDPDDDYDPTLRVNTIATLCGEQFLRDVRDTPLVSSRLHGRFSLRDVEVAHGELTPAAGEAKPDGSMIDAAFMDVEVAQLQAAAESLARSSQDLEAIESVLTGKVGAARAADLSALGRQLRNARNILADRLARRGVAAPTEAVAAEGAEMLVAAAEGARGAQPITGDVATRDDVVRLLDKICEYYVRCEPSSPVPILLERAKRLVPLGFSDLVRELAPGGLDQLAVIRGKKEGE